MNGPKVFLIAYEILGAFLLIMTIGKRRDPVTPGVGALGALIAACAVYLVVLA